MINWYRMYLDTRGAAARSAGCASGGRRETAIPDLHGRSRGGSFSRIEEYMRILIIRHGDPDYVNDSLTPRGDREAELLAGIIDRYGIDEVFVSPLGRAQRTASYSLAKLGLAGTTLGWLREFVPLIKRPDRDPVKTIAWDWRPADWTVHPEFFDKDRWYTNEIMEAGGVGMELRKVTEGLDDLLSAHGYRRDGLVYRVEEGNHKTLAFFCHFGVECVLLGHLLNISPMQLWHGFVAAPTSITSLHTEERVPGIASFRTDFFGATPHLDLAEVEPSHRARFVECAGDPGDGFERS